MTREEQEHYEKLAEHYNAKQKPKTDVFDKIRAEIEQIEINGHIRDVECFNAGVNTVLNIINKYRQEG